MPALINGVLVTGRQVDFKGIGFREKLEHIVGKGRRSVLDDSAGQDFLEAGPAQGDSGPWAQVYSAAGDFLYYIESFDRAEANADDADDEDRTADPASVADWLFANGW